MDKKGTQVMIVTHQEVDVKKVREKIENISKRNRRKKNWQISNCLISSNSLVVKNKFNKMSQPDTTMTVASSKCKR